MLRQTLIALLGILFWLGFGLSVGKFYSSIKRSALKEQPREDGATLEFFAAPRMQFLVRLVLILLIAFMVLVAVTMRNPGGSFYALLIPLAVYALILLARPVPVVVDQDGIRQRRWFLHDKEIKWEDIASVAYGTNTGTTYIRSKNSGPKIRFSPFLVGRSRFKNEIRAHCRDIEIEEDD